MPYFTQYHLNARRVSLLLKWESTRNAVVVDKSSSSGGWSFHRGWCLRDESTKCDDGLVYLFTSCCTAVFSRYIFPSFLSSSFCSLLSLSRDFGDNKKPHNRKGKHCTRWENVAVWTCWRWITMLLCVTEQIIFQAIADIHTNTARDNGTAVRAIVC